jgi:hypothetical protein
MNSRPLAHPGSPPRPTGALSCLLTTVHPERALSRALVEHLTGEMPDIRFVLGGGAGAAGAGQAVDVVWLCGYESGGQDQVGELRRRHPDAVLLVTGKEPEERWAGEVQAAGADCALPWPLDYTRLSQVLHRRTVLRRA